MFREVNHSMPKAPPLDCSDGRDQNLGAPAVCLWFSLSSAEDHLNQHFGSHVTFLVEHKQTSVHADFSYFPLCYSVIFFLNSLTLCCFVFLFPRLVSPAFTVSDQSSHCCWKHQQTLILAACESLLCGVSSLNVKTWQRTDYSNNQKTRLLLGTCFFLLKKLKSFLQGPWISHYFEECTLEIK